MSNEIKYSIKRRKPCDTIQNNARNFPSKKVLLVDYTCATVVTKEWDDGLSRGRDAFSAVFRPYVPTTQEGSLLVDSDGSGSDEYETSARKGINATCTGVCQLIAFIYIHVFQKQTDTRYENLNDRSSFPKTKHPSAWNSRLSCAPCRLLGRNREDFQGNFSAEGRETFTQSGWETLNVSWNDFGTVNFLTTIRCPMIPACFFSRRNGEETRPRLLDLESSFIGDAGVYFILEYSEALNGNSNRRADRFQFTSNYKQIAISILKLLLNPIFYLRGKRWCHIWRAIYIFFLLITEIINQLYY